MFDCRILPQLSVCWPSKKGCTAAFAGFWVLCQQKIEKDCALSHSFIDYVRFPFPWRWILSSFPWRFFGGSDFARLGPSLPRQDVPAQLGRRHARCRTLRNPLVAREAFSRSVLNNSIRWSFTTMIVLRCGKVSCCSQPWKFVTVRMLCTNYDIFTRVL